MNTVDWSSAPEGATHYHIANKGFYRFARGDSGFYGFGGFEPTGKRPDCFSAGTLIERPAVWSGEGLPPVGTVCEWNPNHDGWVQVEILGHSGEETWFRRDGNESSEICLRMAFFRQILTPEQIASENRDGAIHEMVDSLKRWNTVQELVGMLYDAGYRKQVMP